MQRRWRRGCGNVGGDEATLALARSYCNVGGVVAAAALTARLRQCQRQVLNGGLGPRDYAPSKILMHRRWRRGCGNVGGDKAMSALARSYCNVGRVVAAAALTARLRQRQRQVLDGRLLGLRDYAPSKILMQRRWRRGCGDVGGKEEATTAMVDVGWYIVSAK
jgi:hypothetical protein